MKIIGFIVFGTLADLFGAAYLHKAWQWFIAPTFGVNAPNIATTFGLILIYSFFKWRATKEEYDIEDVMEKIARKIGAVSILFFMSWVASIFA